LVTSCQPPQSPHDNSPAAQRPKPFPEYAAQALDLWPYQIALAEDLAQGHDIICLKARQIGVTELLTVYARWMLEMGRSVLVLSKGQLESEKFLTRARIGELSGAKPNKENTRLVELPNGGSILALPATENAGRSFTADLVIVDEAAFHPWAAKNYAAYRPTMADGGQLVMVSTANGASGFFHDRWTIAVVKKSAMLPRFYSWSDRPGRDAGWYTREMAEYEGLPGTFRQEYPSSPEEAFVTHTGLVFGIDADDGIAIFEPTRNLRPAPVSWSACTWRISGVDPGGVDPTAILPVGVTADHRIHVYGEKVFRSAVGAEEVSATWMEYHSQAELDFQVCPPEQEAFRTTLNAMDWKVYKANNDRAAGIALVKTLLKSGRLTIDPRCKQLIRELNSYFWKGRKDMQSGGGNTDTVTPADHHADCLDVLRYICMAILYALPGPSGPIETEWK